MLNSFIPWAGLLWPLHNPSPPHPAPALDPIVGDRYAVGNAAVQRDDFGAVIGVAQRAGGSSGR